jgi:hypothetical protein
MYMMCEGFDHCDDLWDLMMDLKLNMLHSYELNINSVMI